MELSTDFNSRAAFFWSHGLISDSTYKAFTSVCNFSRYVIERFRGHSSPACLKVLSLVSRETSQYVDKYDVTLDVCISSVLSQSKVLMPQVRLLMLAITFYTFVTVLFVFSYVEFIKIFLLLYSGRSCESRCMPGR